MSPSTLLDAAGRRRSPATMPGYLRGRSPRNKGMLYPADPPRVEEIIAVMRQAGNDRQSLRVRAVIAVLWRAGLRISEALSLGHGKGDKRREAGMDDWGFEHLAAWLEQRVELPVGPLFCVIDGPTRGRAWSATSVRAELRALAINAGVRRRFAPHQLRHAHAVELAREGVAVNIIQRQLGHTDPREPHHSRSPSQAGALVKYLLATRATQLGQPAARPPCSEEQQSARDRGSRPGERGRVR